MHGSLRLILATMVALSHLGVRLYGYNIGVFAVVFFYILAGMVSYKLVISHTPVAYYTNRIKRIFPLYFIVLVCSYIIYSTFKIDSYFLSASPTISSYISNITIIPLAYYMYNHIDTFTLIAPAWSLGVELQFYILAPFILLNIQRIYPMLFFSFVVYMLANFNIIQTEYFGYRLIVGVLFIFLLGSLLNLNTKSSKIVLLVVYMVVLCTFSYFLYHHHYIPYNYETMSAILIAIPLLIYTKGLHIIPKYIDNYLGRLSYSVFLSHFPTLQFYHSVLGIDSVFVILFTIFMLSIVLIYAEFKCKLSTVIKKKDDKIPR